MYVDTPSKKNLHPRFFLFLMQCLRSVFCMGEKVCPKNVNLTFELRYVDENSTCGQLCVFVIVA